MKPQSNETTMRKPRAHSHSRILAAIFFAPFRRSACLRPPPLNPSDAVASQGATPPALEKMTEVDAWAAVPLMTPGINIGNTLDNTTTWETGWGNPPITKEFVQSLAHLGFKTVRLPVAWDTYAVDGRIQPDKLSRVREVVDWITGAGMFCVLNIHWDGGWIDSDKKEMFPKTFATFSADAEKKFRSYWEQISTFFAGKNEKLIFEALNEETNFSNEGSEQKAYATLTRVNQLFIDTVRKTGGNNAKRLLIVIGYSTDIKKTCERAYALPKDTIPGRLFISVHYYTPYHVLRPERGRRLGEDDADLGNPRRRQAAGAALRRDEGLLHPQRHPGLHRRVRRDDHQGVGLAHSLDVGGDERVGVEADGSGALGHRDRGLPSRAVRGQPRPGSNAEEPGAGACA